MNMKLSNKSQEIKEKIRLLLTEQNEIEGIKHDALILMSGYLSEIDRLSEIAVINRGELAEKIKVSPSYLTQVFRGNKPLNFETIAKIQRALNIKFNISAEPKQTFISITASKTEFIPSNTSALITAPSNYLYSVKGGQFKYNHNTENNINTAS
ncbi:helix-turn-helix transcriptional regulator [Ferruginibacter lapsinanis]|uniref:helix-turn-helix domain-containing protein n=1 Tax=Ferruginibacter lapsinanis TaxID=563172 RepID=UPI001E2E30CA|nr:helix-turn-helix transcriptional regulator [Ferruginibacter lapsinanis]UEG49261.1 helix-turn-helix transcriptional regulator [Ferruginibacter lapsinanis]